jgi:hypothetical protein
VSLSVAREGLKKASSKSSRVPIFDISTLLEAAVEVSHRSNGNRQRTWIRKRPVNNGGCGFRLRTAFIGPSFAILRRGGP